VSQLLVVSAAQLRVTDEQEWHALRQQLGYRHEARRQQLRFRRDSDAYLAGLEQRLLPQVCHRRKKLPLKALYTSALPPLLDLS
jgi:hypothetical protein